MAKYVNEANLQRFWDNIQGQIGSASDEQVAAWLDEHPEATTTVQDGAVTTAKLADGAVTGAKIASDTITRDKFAVNAVTTTYNLISGRLERGSISTSGVDTNTTSAKKNRCRTNGYIEFIEPCRLWVKIENGYKLAFVTYEADGTFVNDEYWLSPSDHGEFGFVNWNGRKVRLVMAYSDDAEITDLTEFESAVTIERHDVNQYNIADDSFTYGRIRLVTGYNKPYAEDPSYCRTNTYLTFQHDTAIFNVLDGYNLRVVAYPSAATPPSGYTYTDEMYAGKHVLTVDPTWLYRIVVGRQGSSAAMAPREACGAVTVIDGATADDANDAMRWADEDARLAQQLRYTSNGRNSAATNFTLVHFSDIHGDAVRLQRIMAYAKRQLATVDDVIVTGDLVNADWADDFTYWDAAGAQDVLIAIGNHDVVFDRSDWGSAANYKTMAECYARYMAPNIASWGVTYEADKTYYYKDYTNVRLIVLDLVLDYFTADTAQLSWFESALAGARTAGKAVIVAQHYPPNNRVALSGAGAWYDSSYSYVNPARYLVRAAWQDAVQAFITAGGEFVCWLTGHTHADLLCYNSNYPAQIFIEIDTANPAKASPYSDTARAAGTATQDLFNVLGIDTVNKTVRIMRVGASENMFMQQKKMLCFNYATHTVVG